MEKIGPIGVFDSGFGGLTILKEIQAALPQYDYLYLGDTARAPYGSRSFEVVYQYTLEAVNWFFKQGCSLVILACNTASAKALRTIQKKNLPLIDASKRVLGVIRPTSEVIGGYSKSGAVGVLATSGTVLSNSYVIEINKFFPQITVIQQACPMWVPLIENKEFDGKGADYFVEKYIKELMAKHAQIDTLLLACTHYPLLLPKIMQFVPSSTTVISQGSIVAQSLADYLIRHPEIENRCSKNGQSVYYTTDDSGNFSELATIFLGLPVHANHTELL